MKLKPLLLTTGLLMGSLFANAQTYGTWVGATASSFLNYGFTATPATYNTANSASESFLPVATGRVARVYVPPVTGTPANAPASFELTGTLLKLNSAISGTGKFSIYNITDATAVTSLFFDIDFTTPITTSGNGVTTLAFGKHVAGNVFSNSNNVSLTTASGDIFGAIQFAYYGNANIQVSYRKVNPSTGNPYVYSTNNTLLLPNRNTVGPKRVEIYCNNFNTTQYYDRGAGAIPLAPQTFNVYIGGTQLVIDLVKDFPATNEGTMAAGNPINSFVFATSGTTVNTFTLSDIRVGGIAEQVLPIKLSGFTGKVVNSAVQLSFNTESEHENAHFDILRSANGGEFKLLGRVAGSGNSTATKNYSFTDFNPSVGTNYYKLRQIDKDGKSEEFDSIAIKFGLESNNFGAYVNNNQLSFKYNAEIESQADLAIIDLNGKKVINNKVALNKGLNQPSVDVSFIPAGIYVLRFTENAKTNTVKFVKK